MISSGKPEEVFPTNIFSVLNECPPLSTEPKLFNTIPTQFLLTLTHANIKTSKWVSRFLEGQKVIGRFMRYCFFLAGYQSRERLRLINARSSIAQAHILTRPDKKLGFGIFGMTVLSNKNQEGLVAGVC